MLTTTDNTLLLSRAVPGPARAASSRHLCKLSKRLHCSRRFLIIAVHRSTGTRIPQIYDTSLNSRTSSRLGNVLGGCGAAGSHRSLQRRHSLQKHTRRPCTQHQRWSRSCYFIAAFTAAVTTTGARRIATTTSQWWGAQWSRPHDAPRPQQPCRGPQQGVWVRVEA